VNGEHGGDDSGDENADVDGVATFDGRAKTLPSKSKKSADGARGAASTTEEEATGVPPLMNPDLPHLGAVLNKADVVIEILDARDPLAHRSKALETHVSLKEGQKLLLVLNKIGALLSFPFLSDVAYAYIDRWLSS
jgi:nuclear GTP-binding protein